MTWQWHDGIGSGMGTTLFGSQWFDDRYPCVCEQNYIGLGNWLGMKYEYMYTIAKMQKKSIIRPSERSHSFSISSNPCCLDFLLFSAYSRPVVYYVGSKLTISEST
jgi:hypothetical protein